VARRPLSKDMVTMNERTFEPARLRLARELNGWTQGQVAAQVGVTAAALSQFESGATRPSPATQDRLARLLDVPATFFTLPLVDTHEGFFRSLRRTAVTDRRRARAVAHVAHDLATHKSRADDLPEPAFPHIPVASLSEDSEEIERIAGKVRELWMMPSGPAPNIVQLLESHGLVVTRLPLDSTDVDAFSLPFPDRPVIVLGSDKGDHARSRFDAAHELGHLVMHGEQVWGLPEVEKQAHSFAASFLMPRADIYDELPRRSDWPRFFALKKKWRVSIAALMVRAKTLGKMTDADYLTAVKAASARGWRRVEPVPLGSPEQPTALIRLLESPGSEAIKKCLPTRVVEELAAANRSGNL